MKETTLNLYALDYRDMRTYMVAMLFILGNMVLPQLCHLIPQGGITWLPIYFFTLIGAYKYGWKVGLLTGVLSPILNSLFFGMPFPEVLPGILFKSVVLAVAAGYAADHFKRVSIPILLAVVLTYQFLGTLGEWVISDNFYIAIQDFRIGLPGMCFQVIGGYLFIKYLIYK